MIKYYVLVDLLPGIPKSVEVSMNVFWDLQKFVVEVLGGYSWHEKYGEHLLYDIRKADGSLVAYEVYSDD